MPGPSRPKDGVASLAYGAGHPRLAYCAGCSKGVDGRDKPGHDGGMRGESVAKLKVMCARSMHVAVGALGQAFAQASGHEVAFDFGTVGALQTKLDAGETADVVILSVAGIDKLAAAGAAVPGSRKNVARTFIALCVREGAPKPGLLHRRGVPAAGRGRHGHRHQRSGRGRLGGRASRPRLRGGRLGRDDGAEGHAAEDRRGGRPSAWSRARPSSG